MQLDTARFGRLGCDASDLLLFPEGLIGFEHLHAWLPLREKALCWLQAVEDSRVSLPVVSPFDFMPGFHLRLQPDDCRSLQLLSPEQIVVLAVVGQHDRHWTLNLRAPILLRPDMRLGRQVITTDDYSLQHILPRTAHNTRKSA
jgi:flagellar assembly factor FliW